MSDNSEHKNKLCQFNMILLYVIEGVSIVMLLMLAYYLPDSVLSVPLVVVFGIIVFVGGLTISAAIFDHYELADKSQALGLPSGSVRALIALTLILIFAIMVIFMANRFTPTSQTFNFTGSNGTVIYRDHNYTSSNGTITFIIEPSQDAIDFSGQVLTTISTLVVALAGFYFGTRSVAQAQQSEPEVSISLDPKSPYTLKDDEDKKEITVNVKPGNEIIKAEIRDDDGNKGSIRKLSDSNKFMYTAPARGDEEITVSIDFYLLKYPGDIETWLITIPKK